MKRKSPAAKKRELNKLPSHRVIREVEELWLDWYEIVMPVLVQVCAESGVRSTVETLGIPGRLVARLGREICDAMLEEYEERWMKVQG